jgi:uncharacterized membrane protein YfcA
MIFNDVLGGLLADGGVGGIASGFLGITSGGILVPLLVLILGKDQHVAQGISLVAQVVPTSLSGVRNYRQSGHHVPIRWLVWLVVGFAVGGLRRRPARHPCFRSRAAVDLCRLPHHSAGDCHLAATAA